MDLMHWDIYIVCLDVYFCVILMKNKDKCEELCDEDGQFKTCDPYTETCQTTGMVVHLYGYIYHNMHFTVGTQNIYTFHTDLEL